MLEPLPDSLPLFCRTLGARFCIDPKRHFSKGLQVISGKCENQRPNNLENFEGMIVIFHV